MSKNRNISKGLELNKEIVTIYNLREVETMSMPLFKRNKWKKNIRYMATISDDLMETRNVCFL